MTQAQAIISPREQQSILTVNLGLAANIFLAGLKTTIGILGHSPALLADGINSTSDVAYYIVVMIFMRLAGKPADVEHPYGHRQLESIAALIVGSFVITTAITIFWNSINDVYDFLIGEINPDSATSLALVIALLTIVLKLALFIFTTRIGQQTQNAAVLALASDHRNDIFSAIAVTIGITLSRVGYHWVDPLAGALVALLILRTGVKILRESTEDLMDTIPGHALAQQITTLLHTIPRVEQVEEIQAHRFGPYLVANITVGVNGSLSVAAGDEVASQIEQTLLENIHFMRRIHVHYHPTRQVKRLM